MFNLIFKSPVEILRGNADLMEQRQADLVYIKDTLQKYKLDRNRTCFDPYKKPKY